MRAIVILWLSWSMGSPILAREHAKALGDIGPEAAAAIPGLEELLKDQNRRVNKITSDAIRKIEKP